MEQQCLLPSPPRERTVVEGNVVEHPIWKLSNRYAKPMRKVLDEHGELVLDAKTKKPVLIQNVEDYTRTIDLGLDPHDARKRRALVITASLHFGYPTVYAFRILVVIVEKAHALKYASQKIEITPTEITKGLGITKPGGTDYRNIYDALNALENMSLVYVDTYWDITSKRVHPGRRTERLIKKSVFKATREESQPVTMPFPGIPAPEQKMGALGAEADAEPENYVELGDGIWLSLKAGYRFTVDRDYLNRLGDETTQRLYTYLAKKDRDSPFYNEHVVNVGRRLGLAKTRPSAITAILRRTCEHLQTPLEPDGKAFLKWFDFKGKGKEQMLFLETSCPGDVGALEQQARERAEQLARMKQQFAKSAR